MRLAQLVDIENRQARRDRLQDDRFQTDREERIMHMMRYAPSEIPNDRRRGHRARRIFNARRSG